MDNNISFSLVDANINEKVETNVTYENLVDKVNKESQDLQTHDYNMDDYIALELDYNENYTKKALEKIADYYKISKRKKKKCDLIEEIVLFEKDITNEEIVNRRKTMWFYMEEILNDNYLSKFLIFN